MFSKPLLQINHHMTFHQDFLLTSTLTFANPEADQGDKLT